MKKNQNKRKSIKIIPPTYKSPIAAPKHFVSDSSSSESELSSSDSDDKKKKETEIINVSSESDSSSEEGFLNIYS